MPSGCLATIHQWAKIFSSFFCLQRKSESVLKAFNFMTVTSHLAREFKYLRILFMRKLRQQNEERAELKGKAFD